MCAKIKNTYRLTVVGYKQCNITVNHTNLSPLPENDHLANAKSVDEPDLSTNTVEDQCHSGFCRTFVPSVHLAMTEKESIRQSLQLPAVTRRNAIESLLGTDS